jgi:hypothetical protein
LEELDTEKVSANVAIVSATKTKITYDTKGLVTAGDDATTADIADSSNKRYVTDAQLTIIGNTSGTNTGDETQSTIKTKLGAATASVDGYATATQITKLDGIAAGANVGVVPNASITGATKTKITYDSKGLVTSGGDATTADIADSSNKRYVTDAQLTVIGNTSGTNTGDQDLSGYVAKSTYDANTILYATTDNTPVALTVSEQTVVGRATGGNISAIAIDSDLSSVSANDDTIPSAKATKAMGDSKLALAGGTMTGNITLGENTSIDLDPSLSADGKYSGICITGTAGTTLAFGDLIYLAVADSRWELADSDATATAGTPMLGMCVLAANADGDATKILLQGNIRADAAFPTLTVGAPAYVGETAGDIQTTIPTGADNVIRVVGRALTADSLYFNPSEDHQITVA